MSGDHTHAEKGESPKERVDRELAEALDEIRVALPGVELLFGFLLVIPFSERFELLDTPERAVYVACFLLAAGSVALLVEPAATHRFNFRHLDKLALIKHLNRAVIAALLFVALAVAMAGYLVGSVVFERVWGAILAAALAAWFALRWFVFPLHRSRTRD